MTISGWLQIFIYFAVILALVKPLGEYMARVYEGQRTFLTPVIRPLERLIYRLAGVHEDEEMNWKSYGAAVLVFSLVGIVALYLLLRLQHILPLNLANMGPVPADLALNTAVSFVTNTNWQSYGGETTLSYLVQMAGLTVQNFLSAASGIGVLIVLIRGLARRNATTLGNFWVDLTRGTLYILLPLSLLLSLALASQGVVQTLSPYQEANMIEPVKGIDGLLVDRQALAMGPVASQVAIKQLGTNGGGFFNSNSAHPFENPTPLSNFLEMLSILLIPASLCFTFGKMVNDTRQGWAVLAAMVIILGVFTAGAYAAEAGGNPRLASLGSSVLSSNLQPGGNMEGKEVRFGIPGSVIWETATTAASNGSVNSMHDSYTPIGGMVALLLMQLGEVVFGGVGSGLYGMLAFVIIAVFVAGLMVGRTPEYLGKKIEPFEMKMSSLLVLIMPILVLGFTALGVSLESGRSAITNPGPHGFSQILYMFSSTGNNNGSAFAGLGTNIPFYYYAGAAAMFISRFWLILPTLALAGSLGRKCKVPTGAGTLPTTSPLFIGWLILVILLVGALNFFPALALGPVVEHLITAGA